jgi:hypothetical protein
VVRWGAVVNREERRRAGQRGAAAPVHTLCIKAEPTQGGRWEITYAQHPGDVLHTEAACAQMRVLLVELVEAQGQCEACDVWGDVLVTVTGKGPELCSRCCVVAARVLLDNNAHPVTQPGMRA